VTQPRGVQLRVRGQQGFAVSREGGEVVALDLLLDDSLRHRGLARESSPGAGPAEEQRVGVSDRIPPPPRRAWT